MNTELAPITVPTCAEQLLADFLRGRTEATLRAYSDSLRHFAAWRRAESPAAAARDLLGADAVRANWIAAQYRDAMTAEGRAPATINLRLSALRALVTMARRVGMVPWALEVDGVRARAYRDTRGPGIEAVQRLLDATRGGEDGETARDVRDRAILRLLFDLGLRRAEVVSLDVEHLDLAGQRLAVRGKGQRDREWLPLPQPTAEALAAWVLERGPRAGPLFPRACGDGTVAGTRLTPGGVNQLLDRLGAAAGTGRVRPHGLRHTAITAALDATGGDVRSVQRFSRHADVRTLQRYDDARESGAVAGLVAGAVS